MKNFLITVAVKDNKIKNDNDGNKINGMDKIFAKYNNIKKLSMTEKSTKN